MKAKLGSALLATTMLLSPVAQAANACVRAAGEAQDLRSEGKLAAARKELLTCAQKSCNAVVRADCERWLRELDDQTPTVVVQARDARGHDEDGGRVATAAPASPAAPATIVLGKEPSRPVPVAPLILGGVGVAALGAFGYFEVEGQSAYAGLENGCGRTHSCTDAQTSDVRGQFVGAGVALGVAVVALGTAAVLYFTSRTSRPTTTALRTNGFVF